MSAHRRRLPNRRAAHTISFEHSNGVTTFHYVVSYACFGDGGLAEIFLNTDGKVGSAQDTSVSDGAAAISIALQYGCPVEVLQHALKRNVDGSATGALLHALDLVVKDINANQE